MEEYLQRKPGYCFSAREGDPDASGTLPEGDSGMTSKQQVLIEAKICKDA